MSSLLSKLSAATHDPALCRKLLQEIEAILAGRRMRFMEVCGTHTVAIFQSGLRSLLPSSIQHLSGPGCPVCVTHEAEIALLLQTAALPGLILCTFGDLLRVPGPGGQSLKHASAAGADIRIVYSPLDAVSIAATNPQKEIVFAGIGFETTAPAVAASVLAARERDLRNFSILSLHKLVPPALRSLLVADAASIDAFLLPGHVAMVTGLAPFAFLPGEFGKPAAVGGFEPADIRLALRQMAEQLADGKPCVANAYSRAVASAGNPRACALLDTVFSPEDALWRGIGMIPQSGLAIRPELAAFDAKVKFAMKLPDIAPLPGCRCGDVLKGAIQPPECPLFARRCTPATPVGPCMVSTEGSCAAWHKYGDY